MNRRGDQRNKFQSLGLIWFKGWRYSLKAGELVSLIVREKNCETKCLLLWLVTYEVYLKLRVPHLPNRMRESRIQETSPDSRAYPRRETISPGFSCFVYVFGFTFSVRIFPILIHSQLNTQFPQYLKFSKLRFA